MMVRCSVTVNTVIRTDFKKKENSIQIYNWISQHN